MTELWSIIVMVAAAAALLWLFVLISPGTPARDFRNDKDGSSAGWRSGGNVSWFKKSDRGT